MPKSHRKYLDLLSLLRHASQSSLSESLASHDTIRRARPREDHCVKKFPFMVVVNNKLPSSVCLLVAVLCLLTGCPTASEWDRQWREVQFTLEEGRLQKAKELLHHILPSVRDNGPTDEHYGQVIFQLADIARLEGNLSQAESYYWKSLPLIAQSLGPEHLRMAAPLTELATLYEHKGQPKVALPLLKRALTIQEKTWGDLNRQLLPTLKHYHVLLMLTNNHKEAVEILTRISHLEQTPA